MYTLSNIFHVLETNCIHQGTACAVYYQLQSLNIPQTRCQAHKSRYATLCMKTMHFSLFCLTRSLLMDIFPLLKIISHWASSAIAQLGGNKYGRNSSMWCRRVNRCDRYFLNCQLALRVTRTLADIGGFHFIF